MQISVIFFYDGPFDGNLFESLFFQIKYYKIFSEIGRKNKLTVLFLQEKSEKGEDEKRKV